MPPLGANFALGRLYLQASGLGDPYALRLANDDDFTECQQQLARLIGQETLQTVVASVNKAVHFSGDVTVQVGDWAVDRVSAGYALLQRAGDTALDVLSNPSLRLDLRTGLTPILAEQAVRHGGTGRATNSPAYAWLKVAVAVNAVFFAFDFTVKEDGVDDYVVSGVEGTNRFNLETKFVAPGVRTSSSQMDVSMWAGREVELFFGLLGGSSTNCTMTVEGIRFITLAPPKLEIQLFADQKMLLSWPSAAVGYKIETTANLAAPDWNSLPQPPSLSAGRFTLTNALASRAQFFRLQRH